MAVFVLDKRKKPLMPCSEKRARLLLKRGRARVHKMRPFTIRIVDRTLENSGVQPIALKIDPGSKTTGIALVREAGDEHHVLHLAEITHRGSKIKKDLSSRSATRRRRRGNLRFREKRFNNRRRNKGWLPPSLQSRVDNVVSWTKRYMRFVPLTRIVIERARFDTHLMQDAAISGVQYQQGTLAGYEIREYLLQKWNRSCAYCDATNVPLEIDHIQPKSNGGSNRPSNLTLACHDCNQAKGNRDIRDFLAEDPKRLAKILAETKRPLRDAAMMNATRYATADQLKALGLPVETSTGGRTKFNRIRLGVPKTHALDAACVGEFGALHDWSVPTLAIAAMGRGARQRALSDKYGFPRGHRPRVKLIAGFQTGDIVRAEVPSGKKTGVHIGRVAVRSSGSFNIKTKNATIQGIAAKHCKLVQRADGYAYA